MCPVRIPLRMQRAGKVLVGCTNPSVDQCLKPFEIVPRQFELTLDGSERDGKAHRVGYRIVSDKLFSTPTTRRLHHLRSGIT
jgi:hypothetical protein